jgi:hypothetical protein
VEIGVEEDAVEMVAVFVLREAGGGEVEVIEILVAVAVLAAERNVPVVGTEWDVLDGIEDVCLGEFLRKL